MIYTLFFNRMRDLGPEERADYLERSAALRELAVEKYPGFIDIKTYVAEDGERLTVARFEDAGSQKAWRLDEAHRVGQRMGREVYYENYHIVICEPTREHAWSREVEAAADAKS